MGAEEVQQRRIAAHLPELRPLTHNVKSQLKPGVCRCSPELLKAEKGGGVRMTGEITGLFPYGHGRIRVFACANIAYKSERKRESVRLEV